MTGLEELNAEAIVANGVEWLDEHEPGWAGNINLNELAMDDCRACVLGQLVRHRYPDQYSGGDWDEMLHAVGINSLYHSKRLGFDSSDRNRYDDHGVVLWAALDELELEWAKVIVARQKDQ